MRIHSDILTRDNFLTALSGEQVAGRIAGHVSFRVLTEHRSNSHTHAFEVGLQGEIQDRGRRHSNGAYITNTSTMGATYDEWGWLIAALYRIDPAAVWGSVKTPTYADADHFHDITGLSYNLDLPKIIDNGDGADPYPYVTGGPSRIGRRGFARNSGEHLPPYALGTWAKLQPRSADWQREFIAGRTF